MISAISAVIIPFLLYFFVKGKKHHECIITFHSTIAPSRSGTKKLSCYQFKEHNTQSLTKEKNFTLHDYKSLNKLSATQAKAQISTLILFFHVFRYFSGKKTILYKRNSVPTSSLPLGNDSSFSILWSVWIDRYYHWIVTNTVILRNHRHRLWASPRIQISLSQSKTKGVKSH